MRPAGHGRGLAGPRGERYDAVGAATAEGHMRGIRGMAAGALALAVSAGGVLAQAQPDQEPLRIVRAFYAPYVADRTPAGQSAIDLIRPHATAELQRLIDRENACTRRSRGYCALDYDVLVDGQDFKITRLQVAAQDARPGGMTVRASFLNLGRPTAVEFSFGLIGGRWQVRDVVLTNGGRRLTTVLQSNR
jgi:hypothetical protein